MARGLAADPPMPSELAVTTAPRITELDAGTPRVSSGQTNTADAVKRTPTAAPQLLAGTITETVGGLVARHTELGEKRQRLLQLQKIEEEHRQRLIQLQKLEGEQEEMRLRLSMYQRQGTPVHRHEMS